ncbi:translocation/assembly module TamB domain-containing protein [Paraflavitalea pollutisoli]|uniref:translocation/assembly module TamB domain-containing protein n=1 Tax=Paraflavitalea pollutisoli TaxID=3034143 RepID=UPI0023EBACA8|nr:translocation/assembly module TamB domain-containing protein [Paraflavitalea sp. H1-2-19X]
MLLVLIALILLAWMAIQTTPVQNWLVHQVTKRLSKDLNTTVQIKHVDFALFNKMTLEGMLVEDRQKDTLLYAGAVKVNITDWFFFKDQIELKYIGLQDAVIHLQRKDAVWNYRFIADYFGGGTRDTLTKKSSLNLDLKKVEFDNVALLQRDAWRGEDMHLQLGSLRLDADKLDLQERTIRINQINIDQPVYTISNYKGNRPDSLRPRDIDTVYINDPNNLRWNPGKWDIAVKEMKMVKGIFRSDRESDEPLATWFDENHIKFADINATFSNIVFRQDSIKTSMRLSTKERGGLLVKKLNANLKFHPEGMEFHQLDLETNRSHLHNFFAMRYNSIEDMSDFVTKVRMEADFNDADLDSDDIAFFAPAMRDWKKKIRLSGKIKGPVENLTARKLIIEAGKNTYLNGDISIRGLPSINNTFIDFVANDFRTTYSDAVVIVPQLKDVQQPRIDKLAFLQFRGNFTGFINDFVTYGSIRTNLGTIVSDLNMKFPERGAPSYSGKLRTDSFHLGTFVDVDQIGKISFAGGVYGIGMQANVLNAQIDGDIKALEVRGYTYRDIKVKGTVAKRLFNGELTADDPNLQFQLNGLVDLGKAVPEFNFDANITRADLRNIKLLKDSVEVTGKFRFNFSGNNIDNFLGTARVYEASILKKGKRISFDSLNVESKTMGTNKVITVLSNEFDAALVGQFSIRDLPSSFSTFLHKYYPSYIGEAKTIQSDENFSFVFTTKKVDEYIDFFDKNLSGFNYSTVTGRINTKENMLDLNVEVPQFGYRNIAFYNVALKGVGDLDSLSLENSIADVYINDSLHFPGSTISIRSANDISDIRLNTSASQTLNSANLAARVQTMPQGVRIVFNESNFDINGKNWVIDKNGELVLSKQLVTADGVIIHNADQEIIVTTHPSDIGNTNDIKVEMKKVNIHDFSPYITQTTRFEGLLNANIDIMDPFGKMHVELNGDADQFRLDNDSLGRVQLNANYSQRSGTINFAALSDNKDYIFDVKGYYQLFDSTNSIVPLDLTGNFKDTKVHVLEKYLSGVFKDMDGLATGQLRVTGPTNDLKYLGKVQVRNAQMRVNYTNVLYKIPNATFEFKDDHINFGSFAIKDEFGNTGTISRGILKHRGFDDLDFDFALTSNKLLVLATDGTSKDPFFGTVFAKVNMTLKDRLEDMKMDIKGEPADSSKLYIRSGGSSQAGETSNIVWKVYGREMKQDKSFQETNLRINFDVAANNYLKMFVILDELTGDIIEATGHGNLKLTARTDGEFTINGRYDIDRGYYNFNFQSFLRKPFTLRQNTGNYIQWQGDPYGATIKIDAEYLAENVRFSDLGLDAFSLASGSDANSGINNNVRKYRGEVIVVATLKNRLMQPDISFQIEMPQNSTLKNDADALAIIQRIQNDPNELNKQVAFLIVFNGFGPLSTSNNQGALANLAFEGVVINSISGVLSNTLSKQFSNIFQKIFNDKSIKVNVNAQMYSGTNVLDNVRRSGLNIDRTNVNLNIGKSFLDERLTFTFGSALDFGLSSQQVAATQNLQFLPDITAEWKVRADGKVVLTFFYRDSYNYTTGVGARQNRSGASISYRHDFDRLGDIFRSERKRREKAEERAREERAARDSSAKADSTQQDSVGKK